jgi:LmbE family N-acetylglucosaminyl deacetylase
MSAGDAAAARSNSARFAARPIDEGGTPVEVWVEWDRQFPPLDIEDCPALVLVGAHPDDETLGLGATAALLSGRGVTVQVVSVTDGEAAYPGRSANDRDEPAGVRRAELRCAVGRLGLPEPIFLAFPGGEGARWERRLAHELGRLLAGFTRGAWCAATWRGDGHPDHEAVGRAAAVAERAAEAAFIEYPLWMWHWATPQDSAVPWHRVRRVPLTPLEVATKAVAVQCFSSQLQPVDETPVLSPEVVQRLLAVGELVFI